jgi:hypothetical protein
MICRTQTNARQGSVDPYCLLASLLLVILTIKSTDGIWYGDFWEHAAVIKSILLDPAHPSQPFFKNNAPHAFTSPYAYMVAACTSLTGVSVINSLAVFGIFNLALLLGAFRFLTIRLNPTENTNAAFYGVVCLLFLWGHESWGFSGFYYYKLLPYVLPYPSTFCAALTLFAIGLTATSNEKISIHALLMIFAITAVVFLSHPLTFLFLVTALCSQLLCHRNPLSMRSLTFAIAILLAVLVSLLWPFYPVQALIAGGSAAFHTSNVIMYNDVLVRVWPILLCAPVGIWGVQSRARYSFLLTLFGLLTIYVYGHLSQQYSFGRTIAYIALLLQIGVGIGLARVDGLMCRRFVLFRRFWSSLMIAGILLLFLPLMSQTIPRALTIANSIALGRPIANQQSYKYLVFLEDAIKPNSLVLSDIETSWKIPTFNGKVIAALHAQAFVPDDNDRRSDVANFFDRRASADTRLAIIERYKPEYLLLDKRAQYDWSQLSDAYSGASNEGLVYENEQYQLIRLKFE